MSSPDGRIVSWLEDVQRAATSLPPRKKRRLSPPSRPASLKRRRLPTPDMSSSSSSHTPSKRRLFEGDDGGGDDGETPRPTRSAVLPKRPRNDATPSSNSSAVTSSSARSSARSPVKSVTDLTVSGVVAPISIETLLAESRLELVLGDSLTRLFRNLPALSNRGIIPGKLQSRIEATPQFQHLGLSDHQCYDDERPWEKIGSEFDVIEDILESARECDSESKSEAGWNSTVHTKMLDVALRKREGIKWDDMTRATVFPKELISQLEAPDMRLLAKSRMIDYVVKLNVKPNWPLFRRLQAALKADEEGFRQSINATAYEAVRMRPIAIGIETKKPANGDRNKAEAQLAVWATLQLRRFRQATRGKLPPPKLPVLLAIGNLWDVYFVALSDEDSSSREIDMYGPYPIGDTGNLFGIYRLLGSLRVLADWAATDFMAWWDQALPES
ncbi:hypothetical protein JOL62DRAFT_327951 [Phyllosticta paracitricarpa]|uniref:PD-(D/E)XK nuclease-like domain-containing protein n=2 Tax=Phyllosticta TaxID=121621 RepID=A0ABR1MWJ5_9PEZI